MQQFVDGGVRRIKSSEQDIAALGMLLLLAFGIFAAALWFVPINGDDLVLLSAVARTRTPLDFFRADWGLQNN